MTTRKKGESFMTTAIAANRIARVAETLKLILPDDAREHSIELLQKLQSGKLGKARVSRPLRAEDQDINPTETITIKNGHEYVRCPGTMAFYCYSEDGLKRKDKNCASCVNAWKRLAKAVLYDKPNPYPGLLENLKGNDRVLKALLNKLKCLWRIDAIYGLRLARKYGYKMQTYSSNKFYQQTPEDLYRCAMCKEAYSRLENSAKQLCRICNNGFLTTISLTFDLRPLDLLYLDLNPLPEMSKEDPARRFVYPVGRNSNGGVICTGYNKSLLRSVIRAINEGRFPGGDSSIETVLACIYGGSGNYRMAIHNTRSMCSPYSECPSCHALNPKTNPTPGCEDCKWIRLEGKGWATFAQLAIDIPACHQLNPKATHVIAMTHPSGFNGLPFNLMEFMKNLHHARVPLKQVSIYCHGLQIVKKGVLYCPTSFSLDEFREFLIREPPIELFVITPPTAGFVYGLHDSSSARDVATRGRSNAISPKNIPVKVGFNGIKEKEGKEI